MANYATLKAAIEAVIYENGNQEITGEVLQATLLAMVNALGANYQYVGIATPSTNPGTPDQNVFYLASTAGAYVNFGNIVLAENEVAILKYNGSWAKETSGFASAEKVNQLDQEVNGRVEETINLSQQTLEYGYINPNDNTWAGRTNVGHYMLQCAPGQQWYFKARTTKTCQIAVLQEKPTYDFGDHDAPSTAPVYSAAIGFTGVITIAASEDGTITIPSDGHWLYIRQNYNAEPTVVKILGFDGIVQNIAALNNKIDEGLDNIITIDGIKMAAPDTRYVIYDTGEFYEGVTNGTRWFKNIGYTKVSAVLGFNKTDYCAIAFFNSELPSPASYMKSASVQFENASSKAYEADVPEGCKLIAVSNRYNSLANPSITLHITFNAFYESNDLRIKALGASLTRKDVAPLMDENGKITSSFTLSIPNTGICSPVIFTTRARYEGDAAPSVVFKVGRYTSISYRIGTADGYGLPQQWRIPPMLEGMEDIKIVVTIPEGTDLIIDDLSTQFSEASRVQTDVRVDSHLGLMLYAPEQTLTAIILAAQMGYGSCIVNPIKTYDNVWMCYHEDHEILSPDGTYANVVGLSAAQFHAKTFAEIRTYDVVPSDAMAALFPGCKVPTLEEFFEVCVKTGMKPVFSAHPAPSASDWAEIKALLEKYGLLKELVIKGMSLTVINDAFAVFGNNIGGYVGITYAETAQDIESYCTAMAAASVAATTVPLYVEIGSATALGLQSCFQKVLDAGFLICAESGKFKTPYGDDITQMIRWGAVRFTDDVNPNNGLSW